jgi:hypothetical protein
MASLLKFGVENTDRITAIGEFGLGLSCPFFWWMSQAP